MPNLRGGSDGDTDRDEEIVELGEPIMEQGEAATSSLEREDGIRLSSPLGISPARNDDSDDSFVVEDGAIVVSADQGNRFEVVEEERIGDELDDPMLNPSVQYFLKRCPSGKADKGKYIGSCRDFLCTLVEESYNGEVSMAVLRKVFCAIESADLLVEPGMFNLIMTMVVTRAMDNDASTADGFWVLEWLHRANASKPSRYDWGLDRPMRKNGIETAHFEDLRLNMSIDEERFRDFHRWTDCGGNTLRAVFESLLGVVAGAARHGKGTMAEAREALSRMESFGISPDVDTYTQLLLVVAGAARHGGASMQDAEEILQRMSEEGLEPHTVTYGAFIDAMASCAEYDGGATWRDGEAIIEIMIRLGMRPDFMVFVNLMKLVANQAAGGYASATAAGEYRFDPIADASEVLRLMQRIEPPMYPSSPMLVQYLRVVLAAVRRGVAGVAEGEGAWHIWEQVKAGLMRRSPNGGWIRIEHWYRDCMFEGLSLDCFNLQLEVVLASAANHNATILDALKIISRIEAEGVQPDRVTKEHLLAIADATEGHQGAQRQEADSVFDYARSKAKEMPALSEKERSVRLRRECRREPHATAFGHPFRYDDSPPAWMSQKDLWEGLKSVA